MENPLYRYLQPGEHALWEGRPDVRRFVLRGWYFIPFSFIWLAFAIFWESSVITTHGPFFFQLWGIPFVLIGLYAVIGRFFVAAHEARQTWYLLTDRRALIQTGVFTQRFIELDLEKLPALELTHNGANGTITFGPRNINDLFAIPGWPMQQRSNSGFWGNQAQPQTAPAFQCIDNVENVYNLVKEAQRKLG